MPNDLYTWLCARSLSCSVIQCIGEAILFGKSWFVFWLMRLANVYDCIIKPIL